MKQFSNAVALDILAGNVIGITSRHTAVFQGSDRGTFDVMSGNFVSDETAAVRDHISVNTVIPDIIDPISDFDVRNIDITGWRIRSEMGVQLYDGTTSWVTLGTFVVYNRDDTESASGRTVALTAYDVTALVRDSKIESPYTIAAGTNYQNAIQDLVTASGVPCYAPVTGFTTPMMVLAEGTDRLQTARDMATTCGWELLSDQYGNVIVRGIRSVAPPVWTFVEGDDCRMVEVGRSRKRDQVYNIAVVSGEGSTPVVGVAYDGDPASPTYVTASTTGSFGRVPVFLKSQLVTTQAQADLAAQTLLATKRGIGAAINITAFVNPALEPGDTVQVVRSTMDISNIVPLQAVTIDFDPSRFMTALTREANF